MEMNEEQKAKLRKLYRNFLLGNCVAGILYGWFLFFSTLAVVLITKRYTQDEQIISLFTIGSSVIVFAGLFGTIEERRKKFAKEAAEFLPKQ